MLWFLDVDGNAWPAGNSPICGGRSPNEDWIVTLGGSTVLFRSKVRAEGLAAHTALLKLISTNPVGVVRVGIAQSKKDGLRHACAGRFDGETPEVEVLVRYQPGDPGMPASGDARVNLKAPPDWGKADAQ